VSLVHEYSGGIPRTINVICDNALVSGMVLQRQPVDRGIVLEVCRDFALRGDGSRRHAEAQLSEGHSSSSPLQQCESEEIQSDAVTRDASPAMAPRQRLFSLFRAR
jgi:hypothetical protein